MNEVINTNMLAKGIVGFSGKDLTASLLLAEQWAERHAVKLSNYYVQSFNGGKSILVGYIVDEQEVAAA